MTPDDIIQIGPLALALDRVVAIVLLLAFLAGCDWIVRRYRVTAWQPGGLALLAGLVAARAGHVWQHRESYALEPAAALQFWLGGWDWRFGTAGAGLVLVLALRRSKPVVASLVLLTVLSLVWLGSGMGARSDKPALFLPQDLVLEGLSPDGGSARSWRMADLQGRPAVINLWATWCPPCRREMPMLTRAAGAEQRATILMVNQGEDPAQVATFLRGQGLDSAHVALDRSGLLGQLAEARALPTTLFLDREGMVREIHVGEISRVQLDIAIRALQ